MFQAFEEPVSKRMEDKLLLPELAIMTYMKKFDLSREKASKCISETDLGFALVM